MNGYILLFILLLSSCSQIKNDRDKYIKLVSNDAEKKVDVFIDGELFTSYIYTETSKKPVLYPVNTINGTSVTRGYPLNPRPGERVDHPHHLGLWFNYGDVNGLDFWNNSDAIPAANRNRYGTIIHKEINSIKSGDDAGELSVTMEWIGPDGKAILRENTTFIFMGTDDADGTGKRMVDRLTTLTALDEDVSMKDNKEGLLGVRMARELEHPSDDEVEVFNDVSSNAATVISSNNEGVSGMYQSSEGLEGTAVWGTRGKWVNLSGRIDDEHISVTILDHPENIGYPTYWHARGYGLFAANPLGMKELSGGKDELNFSLPSGESITFKHRVIIWSGSEKIRNEQVEKTWEDWPKLSTE